MPEDVKAELIGGIVYMASPLRMAHGRYHSKLALILSLFEAATPGVETALDTTTILGEESEPQPDIVLRLLSEHRGQSNVDEAGYLVGAPEFVAEISHSTVGIDLHQKKTDYFRAGVQEYFVLSIEELEIFWFHFPSRKKLKPNKAGVWKSKVFPGLWIDGPALLACDSTKLIATAQEGLESDEHAQLLIKLKSQEES
jgi:hypothetical protein